MDSCVVFMSSRIGFIEYVSEAIKFNKSVQLSSAMEERVSLAMEATSVENFTDFTRAALMDKCRRIERELRELNPTEYRRLYDGKDYFQP